MGKIKPDPKSYHKFKIFQKCWSLADIEVYKPKMFPPIKLSVTEL